MAFSKKLVKRTDDPTGDDFILQEAPAASGEYAQGVVPIDETGAPSGITANPFKVSVVGTATVSGSVSITGTPSVTVSGTVATSVAAGTDFSSGGAAVDDALISNVPAVLRELRCIMAPTTTVARYLMLFDDADGTVADGTAPIWRMLVPAAGEASETFNPGLDFPTGITAVLSSTATTLTATTGLECFIHAITE